VIKVIKVIKVIEVIEDRKISSSPAPKSSDSSAALHANDTRGVGGVYCNCTIRRGRCTAIFETVQ